MTKIKAMELIREKCGSDAEHIIWRLTHVVPDCSEPGCEAIASFCGYVGGKSYCHLHEPTHRGEFAIGKFPFCGTEVVLK